MNRIVESGCVAKDSQPPQKKRKIKHPVDRTAAFFSAESFSFLLNMNRETNAFPTTFNIARIVPTEASKRSPDINHKMMIVPTNKISKERITLSGRKIATEAASSMLKSKCLTLITYIPSCADISKHELNRIKCEYLIEEASGHQRRHVLDSSQRENHNLLLKCKTVLSSTLSGLFEQHRKALVFLHLNATLKPLKTVWDIQNRTASIVCFQLHPYQEEHVAHHALLADIYSTSKQNRLPQLQLFADTVRKNNKKLPLHSTRPKYTLLDPVLSHYMERGDDATDVRLDFSELPPSQIEKDKTFNNIKRKDPRLYSSILNDGMCQQNVDIGMQSRMTSSMFSAQPEDKFGTLGKQLLLSKKYTGDGAEAYKKKYGTNMLKKSTVMKQTDTTKQHKGFLIRYPHHTKKKKLIARNGGTDGVLNFTKFNVNEPKDFPEVDEMVNGFKQAHFLRRKHERPQLGFNMYKRKRRRSVKSNAKPSRQSRRRKRKRAEKSKGQVGGIGFHTDRNVDDEDFIVYVPRTVDGKENGFGRMSFHQHSIGGDSALFSIDLLPGSATRFQAGHICRLLNHGIWNDDIGFSVEGADCRVVWIIRGISIEDNKKADLHKELLLKQGVKEEFVL